MVKCKRIKLAKLAVEISERINNPSESGYERFVGLEHLDSGNFYVTRWGSTQDVKSAMKLFKAGDILFARRNTYLKRVAVANFDGVCSGDIIVLRQKDIIAEFYLILIMSLESFWEFAISNSAGTMSKRAKWRDISEFEVVERDYLEQEKMVNIFMTLENVISLRSNLLDKAKVYKEKLVDDIVNNGMKIINDINKNNEKGWELKRIEEIAQINKKSLNSKTDKNLIIEYIDIESVSTGKIKETKKMKFSEAPSRARRVINKDDVIISTVRPYLKAFTIIKENKENLICSTGFAVLSANKDVLPMYLYQYTLSNNFINQLKSKMIGSNYPAVNNNQVKESLIAIPKIEEQKNIIYKLEKIDKTIKSIEENIESLKLLKRKLLESILEV